MGNKLISAETFLELCDKKIVNDNIKALVHECVSEAPAVVTNTDRAINKIDHALDVWAYDDPNGFVNYVNGLLAMCDWSDNE